MMICRVKGNVVSSVKEPVFKGHKLLIVQQVELDCKTFIKAEMLALDTVGAGTGELVLVMKEGSSAQQLLGTEGRCPAAAVVVGCIDKVYIEDQS